MKAASLKKNPNEFAKELASEITNAMGNAVTKKELLRAMNMLVATLNKRIEDDHQLLDDKATQRLQEFLEEAKAMLREISENETGSKVASIKTSFSESEGRLMAEVENTKNITRSEIRTITRMVLQEVEKFKGMLPDLKPLEQRIADGLSEVEKKIPTIPTIPKELTPEQIRDKIEVLRDAERVDVSAIKGLEDLVKELVKTLAPQRSFGRALGASVVVKSLYNQSFPETPNGVITAFTLSKAPRTTGAERIYQNNTRRFPGTSNDYTVSGKTVTFNVAPQTGDQLFFDVEY